MTPKRPFEIGIRCGDFISMVGGRVAPASDIFIGIAGGRIQKISPWRATLKKSCARFIDGSGKVALPGLINAHTHLAMTLFRGLEDDLPFQQWLFERIVPLEAECVDAEFVKIGTELAALESIRFGVTTVCDMYFFSETIAAVLDRAGLRALIAQPFASIEFPEDRVLGKDKFVVFERLKKKLAQHPRLTPALGPHAVYTCEEDLLLKIGRLAQKDDLPIHIHLSETKAEVEGWRSKTGKTPIRYLYDLGLLGPKTICAHCVHPDGDDIGLLQTSRATVVYNPDSNLKLGSGIAPASVYQERGIKVAFGTDGSASNNDLSILGAMDVGVKLQKLNPASAKPMGAEQALYCATLGGARALGLESEVGSLEVGKRADVILVDLELPHMQPVHSLASQLVYSAQGLEVCSVMCEGRLLFNQGKFVTLDERKIYRRVEAMRKKIRSSLERIKKAQK